MLLRTSAPYCLQPDILTGSNEPKLDFLSGLAGAVSPIRTYLHSGVDAPNPSDPTPRPAATQPGRLSVGPYRSVG
jgi:hypothetical protein